MTVWSETRNGARFLYTLLPSRREKSGLNSVCDSAGLPAIVEHWIYPLCMRPPAFKYCDLKIRPRKYATSASEQRGSFDAFISARTARASVVEVLASSRMRVAYCSNLDPAWRSEIARPSRQPPRVPTAASRIVENNVKSIRWLAFVIDKFTYYSCRATHKQATVPLSHGESNPKDANTAYLGEDICAFHQFRLRVCSPFLVPFKGYKTLIM